ncbi:MAG: hypothetical protein LBR11_07840 [Deltaproteobacteria bacterium]|jgi:hypothetical protein|nr:hypothetical protein [Deltaproteobacteria bacterium]
MATRLWAWPAVSGQLSPPEPAFYLSWPAWEKFLTTELREERHPWLTPVFLPEPVNFLASLRSLLALAQEGGPASPAIPFFSPETAQIRSALAGRQPATAAPERLALALALGHLARRAAQESLRLTQRAQSLKADLLMDLTDEPQETVEEIDSFPDPSPKMSAAWLTLARPLLRPGDRLWPAYGSGEELAIALGVEPDPTGFLVWPGLESPD